jgi:hypothetical protein
MRLLIAIFAFFVSSVNVLLAQAVEVGVEGGIRTTDDFSDSLSSESKRYMVGPTMDVRLPKRFSVEVDALYQRFGFTGQYSYGIGNYGMVRERTNSWEFPVILKYRLPIRPMHPFVGIGYAPRILNWAGISSGARGYTPYYNERDSGNYPVTHGIVISGGVSLGAGHFRFTPEVRYTYWTEPYLNGFLSRPCCGGSNQNEVSVLLGIRWH